MQIQKILKLNTLLFHDQIEYLLERQKFHLTPIIEQQVQELEQKNHYCVDLSLINRNLKFARLASKNELPRV